MARRDWAQVAADFNQKYLGTLCRYVSPITGIKEIFMVSQVHQKNGPPDITLFSQEHGEIFISYGGDVDLDFTFPDVGYFQNGNTALKFGRNHMRQWKKGLCDATAYVECPYYGLYPLKKPLLNAESMTNAFKDRPIRSIPDALADLNNGVFSVALNKHFVLGHGKDEKIKWLWFEDQLIAEVNGEGISLATPIFRQELDDYMRDSKSYVRVIQTA